ncbi:MAG: LamG-like jellyroll fold domain-containing protein, partial [Bacteroidia bacterium]
MKSVITFLLLFVATFGIAQNVGDTITIKTFNYTQTYGVNQWSPGIRDTVIDFSTLPNVSFEKVLMSYNMRCKDAKISNANNRDRGCGEWDISNNTYLHDSSRVDSVSNTHPNYIISGFNGTEFDYTTKPLYNYYRFRHKNVIVDQVNSENQFDLFLGSTENDKSIDGLQNSGKSHYLYSAAELSQAGFATGNIDGILMNAKNEGTINFLKIRVKGVAFDSLNNQLVEQNQFTQVYFGNYSFVKGGNRVQFIRPFEWNGTDNVLIEFSYTNSEKTQTIDFDASSAPAGTAISAYNNYSVDLSSNGHFDIPSESMSGISNEITVSMWVYGNPDQLPANTSVIHATGAGGERDVNVHLPWGNSQVYWDCGGDGNGYDRISKSASGLDLEGRWNHWAFTKNANTGDMKIYLNGELWHSGTGKSRNIDIDKVILGKSQIYNNNYKGSVDELRIWDKELDQQTIKLWMKNSVDQNHPNYNSLVAYYPFDEGEGSLAVNAVNTNDTAKANDAVVWNRKRGIDLDAFFNYNLVRPNITLVQGDYDTSVVISTVLDSTAILPRTATSYQINENKGTLKNDEVEAINTSLVWRAKPQIIYNETSTTKFGEIPVAKEGTYTIENLNYYSRRPAKIEIMSFVTPYGVNLDLGKNGKTWIFDVTDFMPIFKGQKRMTMEHGGQWMEDMDIQFHFIVGTPVRQVLDFNQIWRVQRVGYQTINSNRYFPPRKIELLPEAEHFEIRSVITGHGQEGEFTPRDHYLWVNGNKEFTWRVWTECAENPIYPQGGTWVYDRAGWCPGAPSDVHRSVITDLVTPGETTEFDYDVEVASGTSNYFANHQLISYGAISHQLDARLLAVKTPSKRVEYSRFNSICHAPTVIIQNTGAQTLTSATIKYWINDAAEPMQHKWQGSLEFNQTAEVKLNSLPAFWKEADETINVFHAEVVMANGEQDEYAANNIYHSEFNLPDVLPNEFKLFFRTNNFPLENKIEILDYAGNVVFAKENMTANTTYTETINLGLGCYTLKVYDYDDD